MRKCEYEKEVRKKGESHQINDDLKRVVLRKSVKRKKKKKESTCSNGRNEKKKLVKDSSYQVRRNH